MSIENDWSFSNVFDAEFRAFIYGYGIMIFIRFLLRIIL